MAQGSLQNHLQTKAQPSVAQQYLYASQPILSVIESE